MNNKTRFLNLRLTPKEYEYIRKQAVAFGGISNYIRWAEREFSNPENKQTIDLIDDLFRFHFEYGHDMSDYGRNLNFAVKQINELALAGKLTIKDINDGPLKEIQSLQKYLDTVKRELDAVIDKAQKSGLLIKIK